MHVLCIVCIHHVLARVCTLASSSTLVLRLVDYGIGKGTEVTTLLSRFKDRVRIYDFIRTGTGV